MLGYFAFGSNMDPARIEKRLGYLPKSECAILTGYQLKFNKIARRLHGIGWANIIPNQSQIVEGKVYFLTDQDFNKLDGFENVKSNDYQREGLQVRIGNDEMQVIAYVACEGMVDNNLKKTTKSYLQHLLKGVKCLSKQYYEKLKNVETHN